MEKIEYCDQAVEKRLEVFFFYIVRNHCIQAVCGVKGKSALDPEILPHFDTIKSDYMHCVLLGIIRKLLSLGFDNKSHNSKNEWFVVL